jgi:hypothetical protein
MRAKLSNQLVNLAVDHFGAESLEELLGPSRAPHLVQARRAVWLVGLDVMGWFPTYLAAITNRHVSSTKYGIKQARAQLRNDPLFFDAVEQISTEIRSAAHVDQHL